MASPRRTELINLQQASLKIHKSLRILKKSPADEAALKTLGSIQLNLPLIAALYSEVLEFINKLDKPPKLESTDDRKEWEEKVKTGTSRLAALHKQRMEQTIAERQLVIAGMERIEGVVPEAEAEINAITALYLAFAASKEAIFSIAQTASPEHFEKILAALNPSASLTTKSKLSEEKKSDHQTINEPNTGNIAPQINSGTSTPMPVKKSDTKIELAGQVGDKKRSRRSRSSAISDGN